MLKQRFVFYRGMIPISEFSQDVLASSFESKTYPYYCMSYYIIYCWIVFVFVMVHWPHFGTIHFPLFPGML